MTPHNASSETPDEKPEVPPRRLQPQGTPGGSLGAPDRSHDRELVSEHSGATAAAAAQRRKERGAATDGANEPARYREEVAGPGSGETAGGSPATAKGDNASAEQPLDDTATSFDPEALSGGGGLSNTPPPKTKLGGEDYLTVNFYLKYEDFASLRSRLEDAKLAAQNKNPNNLLHLGDVSGTVSPGGVKVGAGKKAGYMPWRVDTDSGVSLLIADREEPHRTQPSVQLSAPSTPMMRLGFHGVWGIFHYLIEQLGAQVIANKISRVDPCLDLAGTSVTEFSEPFDRGWFVTRARSRRRHEQGLTAGRFADGRRDTGFGVGKAPLSLRVYDKLIESARSPVKLEILTTSRWGDLPDAATRIEYQIGRRRLKTLGIDTVEDWIAKRADVVDYLVSDWFRLTNGPVDRSHADRTPTHAKWEAVKGLFLECYGEPVGVDLSPLPTLVIDPNQRLAVAFGVLKTAIVELGYPVRTNRDYVAVVNDLMEAFIVDRDMADEVARREIEKGLAGLGIG